MSLQSDIPKSSTAATLLSLFLVVASLHLAEEILVPLALAILLSFLLGPLVTRMERLGTGRVLAVILVSIVTSGVLFGVGWLVTDQLSDLATKAPLYRENLKSKLHALKAGGGGWISELKEAADELQDEIKDKADVTQRSIGSNKNDLSAPVEQHGNSPEDPLWARIVPPPPSPLALLRDTIGPLMVPLTTFGIVLVLSIFMLIHREDLRDKVIRLIGENKITTTTEAMDEAAHKVGVYLAMQLLVNVSYGVPVGIALYFIGVPNAALFGVLATLLRFIPYVGPGIAAAVPIALSFAISDGWAQPLYTVGIFIALELVSNNVVEPLLYGRSTGMSAVAILVAAIFWTWCWGSVGLLLSTPLTVCFVVLGKHVPQLRFLAILLGDQPALEPKMRLYQRLLALDHDEGSRIVYESLKNSTLVDVFQKLFLGALRLSEDDRERGVIEPAKAASVREGLKELMDETIEINRKRSKGVQGSGPNFASQVQQNPVICLPARDDADELSALMLKQVLLESNIELKVISVSNLASEMLSVLKDEHPPVVVLSALPPSARSHTRYLLKRLSATFPDLRVLVGFWDEGADRESVREKISTDGPITLAFSLDEAVSAIKQLIPLESSATVEAEAPSPFEAGRIVPAPV